MTVLFEEAISQDIPATHIQPTSQQLEKQEDIDIPVNVIARTAEHHDELTHPERNDWIRIPLHEPDSPELSGEYIAYRDHETYGKIYIYLDPMDSEDVDFLKESEFRKTRLARRIRYWHPDYIPSEYPDYYSSPIDENEAPRNTLEDKEAFFDDLENHIENEKRAELEENKKRAKHYSAEEIHRYQDGAAIPNLTAKGRTEDGKHRFIVPGIDGDSDWRIPNEYGIYEDNKVLLTAPGDEKPSSFPVEASVDSIKASNIYLNIPFEEIEDLARFDSFFNLEKDGFGLILLLNPTTYDRELDAVRELRNDEKFSEILTGQKPLTFGDSSGLESIQLDSELNQEQQQASRYGLLADDLFVLHGPPGTGKTRTLIEVIRRSVQADRSVLVSADSNQAIDNILVGSSVEDSVDPGSLHAFSQYGSGELSVRRVNAVRSSNSFVREKYMDSGVNRPDVVVATNSSAAKLARSFDVAIIDEATQSTLTASCIPVSKADKVVLAGDHRQLPPYSATESPPETSFGVSLYEHLYSENGIYEGVGIQLRTQYRMHPEIMYVANRWIYNNSLRSGREVETVGDREPLMAYNVGGDVERRDTSYVNETEAVLVSRIVEDLVEDGLDGSEIGVISAYSAQIPVIEEKLGDSLRQVHVDTIDSFQGSEREAVVVSLVRSNSEGDVGFLGRPEDGPRRLNVALTRAKKFCAVVGDWHTLRYECEGKCDELYSEIYRYLRDNQKMKSVDRSFLSLEM